LLQTVEPIITSQPVSREIPGYNRRRRTRLLAMIVLAVAAVLIILSVLTVGSVKISFLDVWGILLSHLPLVHFQGGWPDTSDTIIWGIRLPRTLLAGLVGAALGVAGATYQGLFRNPWPTLTCWVWLRELLSEHPWVSFSPGAFLVCT
jgi:ABC-type enterobactin transport system permease subunit